MSCKFQDGGFRLCSLPLFPSWWVPTAWSRQWGSQHPCAKDGWHWRLNADPHLWHLITSGITASLVLFHEKARDHSQKSSVYHLDLLSIYTIYLGKRIHMNNLLILCFVIGLYTLTMSSLMIIPNPIPSFSMWHVKSTFSGIWLL